jgi:RimJ/RimL family protein N-acetyltransferase
MKNAFRAGERVCLRPLEVGEGEALRAWLNDPENHQFLALFRPLNGLEEREFLEGIHKKEGEFFFGIALREEERLIGSCGLHRASLPNRSAELGILVGDPAFQGKGYGAEAIGLLLEYAFNALGLHRVGLRVYANNVRGIRCYEKCGFRREGASREARWWGGRFWGILEGEWRARNTREAVK